MQIELLLPGFPSLRCQQVTIGPDRITIEVVSVLPSCPCPNCGRSSSKVHSRYTRTLADLSCLGSQVAVRWQSRRFFCQTSTCPKRTFTERRAEIASPYARKTARMVQALRFLAFSSGGESGSRLARRLAIPASPDTMVRTIRRAPLPAAPAPRVLSVDDWAFRRGHRYGTILCDLERHRVVDLLPERSSGSFADWLRDRPGVEIICRDRADYFIKGAREGAPQAVQVADRWHLLKNLREAMMRVADRYPKEIKAVAEENRVLGETASPPATVSATVKSPETSERPSPAEQLRQERRARRLERYERVLELHRQKVPFWEIARRLGMNRETVARFVHAGSFPERARRSYSHRTDPFLPYLRQRWEDGCRSEVRLFEELKQKGFDGSYDTVRRQVARWRTTPSAPRQAAAPGTEPKRLSSRSVAWLLVKREGDLDDQEQKKARALCERCPALRSASDLAREFAEMVRQRKAEALTGWIARTCESEVPAELRTFAAGLKDDLSAVTAALTLPWNNGQAEGQVNRLKLIKRQMFGRANFDLLRQRVLMPAA